MRILVIAPHMDDEVLGAGGTIAKHVAGGDNVTVCFVAHRVYAHKFDEKKNEEEKKCALDAKKILGYKSVEFFGLPDERLGESVQKIIIPLEKLIEKLKPEVVYVCHHGDNNQDHKAVFEAAAVALRPLANKGIKKVLCYEVPSSTEQSPPFREFAFIPNVYVDIEKHLKAKIKAFECYKTEMREFPHPRSSKGLETLALKRGSEIGFGAAEAFALVREKL